MAMRFFGMLFCTLAVIGAARADDPKESKPKSDEKSRVNIVEGRVIEINPRSIAFSSEGSTGSGCEKSKRSRSGATREPFCMTDSPNTLRNAA